MPIPGFGDNNTVKKLTITPFKENVVLGKPLPELDTAGAFTCQFNPERISLGKNNLFRYFTDIGSNVPEVVFSGGLSRSLEIDLIFDSTDQGSLTGQPMDVRKTYAKLVDMMKVRDPSDEYSEPPHVCLQWGKFLSFPCVIDSISEEFELFADNGVPLRAEVRICFKQAYNEDVKGGTNPTSRSEARRTWVVERGQRLDWIAHQAYGEPSAWRHIAEANNILDPTHLVPGQILNLTPLT
jgi:hypothetical protein